MKIVYLIIGCILAVFGLQAAEGKIVETSMRSRLLKNTRDLWVYTPPGYNEQGAAYPLLIVFDGQAYTCDEWVPTPKILDDMISKGEIRPVVAVFISSLDQKRRNRELPCYEPFARFVANDVIPYMQKNYHVSTDPSDVIAAGSSYGGLAAAYVALLYPEQVGNVLSQSGAFYWAQPKCDRNPCYLIRQYRRTSGLPIRFYLEVGDQEGEGRNSILAVNREMNLLLKQKGYDVTYREFTGGHEYKCWRDGFPYGLRALLGVDTGSS